MGKLLFFFLVFIAVCMAVAVGAFVLFGPWGLVGLIAVMFVGLWLLKVLLGKLFFGALKAPFRAKGKVLEGAQVMVHGVTPAAAPDRSDDDEGEDEYDEEDEMDEAYHAELEEARREREAADAARRWYFVDVTITPKAGDPADNVIDPDDDESPDTPFTMWEPDELMMASLDSDPEDLDEDADEWADIAAIKVYRDGEFLDDDEQDKFVGAQRLQLHVGVNPDVRTLQFRYYFELFGEVEFPEA